MRRVGLLDGIGSTYAEGRRRITELVVDLSPDEAATRVPTCPAWSVHDVVAHLAGSCTDVLAGRTEGITTESWADAQVAQRRDRSVPQLLEEWEAAAARLESAADRFPSPMGVVWILDITTHEHDVRTALGRPGARDARGIDIGLDLLVGQGLHGELCARSLGPLSVRTHTRSWVVGAESADVADGTADTPAEAGVEASAFELFRSLTGRRSRAQIAAMGWSVDPEPYLDAFQFASFTTSPDDIDE